MTAANKIAGNSGEHQKGGMMDQATKPTFFRVLLIWLGIQKGFDALACLVPTSFAIFVFKLFGFEGIEELDTLHQLLMRLWGGASLAWAYFLLKAAKAPERNHTIIEGCALGFLALGFVAVFTPMPMVRIIGLLFFVEAILLHVNSSSLQKRILT